MCPLRFLLLLLQCRELGICYPRQLRGGVAASKGLDELGRPGIRVEGWVEVNHPAVAPDHDGDTRRGGARRVSARPVGPNHSRILVANERILEPVLCSKLPVDLRGIGRNPDHPIPERLELPKQALEVLALLGSSARVCLREEPEHDPSIGPDSPENARRYNAGPVMHNSSEVWRCLANLWEGPCQSTGTGYKKIYQ
eukprot:CAMPEP_0172619098 /NCGR_PEP_ID=MMETSP1068-20121228/89922_1 /TAXON_ID=35684 /ORGANISM="Pseudopedinella elastica, Strain CCMP716" /LENGTH=196 /DNA_ID=CAMNT_0013425671 /DNA_START=302 /DNA_END=892 /DNA_ORIENTATION=+